MSNLQKFAIIGSRSFNNYYLMQKYLDKYLPPHAIIVTGHAEGADRLAECYSSTHKIPLEVYEANWEIFGSEAVYRQRKDIVANSFQCIAFWDGKSTGTKTLIDMFNKAAKTVTIVDISDDDIIKQHPLVCHVNHDPFDVYIGRGHNSPFGNPFKITAENTRTVVLALYTDYLLRNPDLIKQVLQLEGKRLGCWCHNEYLCHGDVIYWLLTHAKSDLQKLAGITQNVKDEPVVKYVPLTPDQVLKDFPECGSPHEVSTSAGTVFAVGYTRIIQDQYGNCFMEMTRDQLIRSMVHRLMEDLQGETDDSDKVQLRYRVNDKTKTEVFYRQKEFNDDFKSGRWYIKIKKNEDDTYNVKYQ